MIDWEFHIKNQEKEQKEYICVSKKRYCEKYSINYPDFLKKFIELSHRKICTKCGENKMINHFNKKGGGRNGLNAQCKSCIKNTQMKSPIRVNAIMKNKLKYLRSIGE